MLDLSRESVEYVCTRFRSPHIARKYGHKIYADYQDPYLEALIKRASKATMVSALYIIQISDDLCRLNIMMSNHLLPLHQPQSNLREGERKK